MLKPKKLGKIAGGEKVARIGIEPSGQWCRTTRATKYVVSPQQLFVHWIEIVSRYFRQVQDYFSRKVPTEQVSPKQAILQGISVWRIFDLDC